MTIYHQIVTTIPTHHVLTLAEAKASCSVDQSPRTDKQMCRTLLALGFTRVRVAKQRLWQAPALYPDESTFNQHVLYPVVPRSSPPPEASRDTHLSAAANVWAARGLLDAAVAQFAPRLHDFRRGWAREFTDLGLELGSVMRRLATAWIEAEYAGVNPWVSPPDNS